MIHANNCATPGKPSKLFFSSKAHFKDLWMKQNITFKIMFTW